MIVVYDEKIKINIDSQLQSIASVLFNQAKKQSSAINSIKIIKEKTEKKLMKFKGQTEAVKENLYFHTLMLKMNITTTKKTQNGITLFFRI